MGGIETTGEEEGKHGYGSGSGPGPATAGRQIQFSRVKSLRLVRKQRRKANDVACTFNAAHATDTFIYARVSLARSIGIGHDVEQKQSETGRKRRRRRRRTRVVKRRKKERERIERSDSIQLGAPRLRGNFAKIDAQHRTWAEGSRKRGKTETERERERIKRPVACPRNSLSSSYITRNNETTTSIDDRRWIIDFCYPERRLRRRPSVSHSIRLPYELCGSILLSRAIQLSPGLVNLVAWMFHPRGSLFSARSANSPCRAVCIGNGGRFGETKHSGNRDRKVGSDG